MKREAWKWTSILTCGLLLGAGGVLAKEGAAAAAEKPRIIFFPTRDVARRVQTERGLVPKVINLSNHGGPVISSARVVLIFWGPTFNNSSSPDYNYARSLIAFRNQLGTTDEYRTITEYSGIQTTILSAGTPDWFDTSLPPTNVTDANVQAEVNRYLSTHTFDLSTIYEVVLPRTSYSSAVMKGSTNTSCGGPNLQYCAYHSWMGSGSSAKKYSVQPYPSCAGCQTAGFTDAQNQEHFVTHETREAATDPLGNAWYDTNGDEADDKCAWSPTPFVGTGGYGYQYEWSNAAFGCIGTRAAAPLTVNPISCSGNFKGSTQISCFTSVSGGTPPYTLTWSYSGTANSWSSFGYTAVANYNPPGCGFGSTFNNFVATVVDALGNSNFASISPLSCF